MPNTQLTVAEITSETETSLGGGNINVELKAADYTKAIKDALRVYNRYRPQRSVYSLAVTPATKKYLIDQTNVQGVINVSLLPSSPPAGVVDVFDYGRTGLSIAGDMPSEINQQLGYQEDTRKIMSTDPDWKASWEGSSYYLYIDIRVPCDCTVTYIWHLSTADADLDDSSVGLPMVRDSDVEWFLAFVLAKCKQILGRVLRKFGGVATSDGGTDQVDGDTLTAEGKEEEANLMITIKKRRATLPPTVG
jgi:hypothetical protein